MLRVVNGRVIGRDGNIVLVDFSHEPNPPAPRFPGASGLREQGVRSARLTTHGSLRPRERAAEARGQVRTLSQTLRAIVRPRISNSRKIATKM